MIAVVPATRGAAPADASESSHEQQQHDCTLNGALHFHDYTVHKSRLSRRADTNIHQILQDFDYHAEKTGGKTGQVNIKSDTGGNTCKVWHGCNT
ncbi:unnamed protein product [Calypogeia fissa]